jgi:hypothetical protein
MRVESAMFEWLSLPSVTEQFPKGRPALPTEAQRRHEHQATHLYESGLDESAANYVPLTPSAFCCAPRRCIRAGSPSPIESDATPDVKPSNAAAGSRQR